MSGLQIRSSQSPPTQPIGISRFLRPKQNCSFPSPKPTSTILVNSRKTTVRLSCTSHIRSVLSLVSSTSQHTLKFTSSYPTACVVSTTTISHWTAPTAPSPVFFLQLQPHSIFHLAGAMSFLKILRLKLCCSKLLYFLLDT